MNRETRGQNVAVWVFVPRRTKEIRNNQTNLFSQEFCTPAPVRKVLGTLSLAVSRTLINCRAICSFLQNCLALTCPQNCLALTCPQNIGAQTAKLEGLVQSVLQNTKERRAWIRDDKTRRYISGGMNGHSVRVTVHSVHTLTAN